MQPTMLLAQTYDASRGDHSHMANEFLLMLCGSGRHTVPSGTDSFGQGDLFFFPKGQVHQHELSRQAAGITLRVRDEAFVPDSQSDRQARSRLNFFKRQAFLGRARVPLTAATAAVVTPLFERAVEEDNGRPPGYRCVLKGLAFQILVVLGRDEECGFRFPDSSAAEGIIRVLEYLDRDSAPSASVAEMAELACLSRSHFHAMFKQTTGTTLVEHQTRLRLARARRLLVNTGLDIRTIALECGFSGLGRFYAAFHKQVGMPPGAYRQAERQKRGVARRR